MSIAMQDHDGSSLDFIREKRRTVSVRRIEANRRNARKSTGPRTKAGKKRASRNSMKHGLCAMLSHLPTESAATFNTFVAELEEELQPRTPLQRIVFNQIANLTWRLQRLPEAQTRLFAEEMNRIECDKDEAVSPADVLARRFSEAPSDNGFTLMDRYERQMRNALFRLFRQYDHLKKHRETVPYDEESRGQCLPPERAWDPRRVELQREMYPGDEQKLAPFLEAQSATDASPIETDAEALSTECGGEKSVQTNSKPGSVDIGARSVATPAAPAERTQSNPAPIRVAAAPAGKCAPETQAPVTERSQRDPTRGVARSESAPVASNANPIQSAGHPADDFAAPAGTVESSTGMGETPMRLNTAQARDWSSRTGVSPAPVKSKGDAKKRAT